MTFYSRILFLLHDWTTTGEGFLKLLRTIRSFIDLSRITKQTSSKTKRNLSNAYLRLSFTMSKTVTVLGALGAQGGSVVTSLLEDDADFTIRAVTRSVDSDDAKALQAKEVQVVAGNTKQPETLKDAFTGADAAFIVVNFWDPEIMGKEEELTKKILDVAKECGVKHILYSSLANSEQVSGGKLKVPHFSMKAKAADYAKSLGFPYLTFVEPAMYYSNFFSMKPTEQDDGSLVWNLPAKGKISAFDPNTGTGPATVVAIKDPETYNNQYLLLEADSLTPEEMVDMILKKMGKKGTYNYVEPKVFASFGFPGAEEIAEMFEWFTDYGYFGPETVERKHSSGKAAAGGKLLSFQQWLDTEAYKKFF